MWQPTSATERSKLVDVLRGLALFGVLAMNLMGSFRISLFDYIVGHRVTGGWTGEVIDQALELLIESKAFIIFSFLFGAGAAMQAERAARRGASIRSFLCRRYFVLMLFGAVHIILLWNGDILLLYGVCGLLLVPLLPAAPRLSCVLGTILVVGSHIAPVPIRFPTDAVLSAHAAQATQIYGHGSFTQVFLFRQFEFRDFIVPLLLASLGRTAGLMLLGAAAWSSGLLAHPAQHRRALKIILMVSSAGAVASYISDLTPTLRSFLPSALRDLGTTVLLAFAYLSAALLWFTPQRLQHLTGVAAVGRMALTNYLLQSVVLSLLFYGFGLGLFGKLTPAPALVIVVALYAAQIAFSSVWLSRFHFGPVEWLWRSLTYGRFQPLWRRGTTADSLPVAPGL